MPIIQSRVISLIRAANDALQAFTRLQTLIETFHARQERRQISLEQAWSELVLMASLSSNFFSNQLETIKTIALEEAHFRLTERRNIGAARRAERSRRRRGIEPAPERKSAAVTASGETMNWGDEITLPISDVIESWREPEPDDFESGAELEIFGTPIGRPDALSVETRALIELEAEILSAPTGHASTILGADKILCQCTFCGTLVSWREHLVEVSEQESTG